MAFSPEQLLRLNRAWVKRKTEMDPSFFERLAAQQTPQYFWIGCSDSRVPATEIVDLDPGEMFVHRNVGNIASADDPNFMAALIFAVRTLRVSHIIVTGHYGCGGVRAAVEPDQGDAVSRWILPIRRHYEHHRPALEVLPDTDTRCNRLAELHVIQQVKELSQNPVITQAWADGQEITLHGWVYDVRDGIIHPICRQHRVA